MFVEVKLKGGREVGLAKFNKVIGNNLRWKK